MNHPSQVLPELIAATLSCTLWFVPKDLSVAQVNIGKLLRATGYSTSLVLYGKGYLCLLLNEERFRTVQEKTLIDESVELELYTYRKGAELDKAKLEIKRELMEVAAPNFQRMYELEVESTPKPPEHPELSEEQRFNAARNAVEAAIAPTVVQPKFTEEDIRKEFPETGDATCWSAICKALGSGYSKQEIVEQVLQATGNRLELGKAYFELLKVKHM
jgi:hypothetical protein